MQIENWLLFSLLSLSSIATPGPAILLAVSNAINKGKKSVLISSLGNGAALFVSSGIAMLGVGVIIKNSLVLFLLLKAIGTLYLIYLGIKFFYPLTQF